MDITGLIPHIEALIFASDKPLTPLELTELINNAFGFMEDKITLDQVEASIEGIVEKYNSEFYPFEVRESGGGWQFLTKKDFHKTVAQINGDKFMKRLSPAALETLSIIAYKQPVTKGEIEAIRGVSADYAIQKLLEKELVIISGRNEKLPGHPLVYATSKNFMDYFGINSAEELPKIKEVLADQEVMPTPVNEDGDAPATTQDAPEDGLPLVVGEDGELTEVAVAEDAGEDDKLEAVVESEILEETVIADENIIEEEVVVIGSEDDNGSDEELADQEKEEGPDNANEPGEEDDDDKEDDKQKPDEA